MRDTHPKPVSHDFPELQAWAGLVETQRRRDLGKDQEKPGEKWRERGEKQRPPWELANLELLEVGVSSQGGHPSGLQKCQMTPMSTACTPRLMLRPRY